MSYLFAHEGKAYAPDGLVACDDVDARNRDTEAQEIAWLGTHPDRVFLYVTFDAERYNAQERYYGLKPSGRYILTTWLGTVVDEFPRIGPRRSIGFGGAYRRAITCRIYGQRYHGWYFESSGDYCRLRKGK